MYLCLEFLGFSWSVFRNVDISEAEEIVSRLIQTVAARTSEVQEAMEELEFSKNITTTDAGLKRLHWI